MSDSIGIVLWGPLLIGAGLIQQLRSHRTARLVSVALLVTVLVLCIGVLSLLVVGSPADRELLWPSTNPYADALAGALLPILVGCPLAMLAASPRMGASVEEASDTTLVAGCALGALLVDGLVPFFVFWTLSLLPAAREASRTADATVRRAFTLLLVASSAPLALAFAALLVLAHLAGVSWPFDPRTVVAATAPGVHERWISLLLWLAFAARLGAFPLHAWAPIFAERARPHVAHLTVVSPFPLLLALRVCLTLAAGSESIGDVLVPLAAASIAYGALVALGQDNAFRQLGFLWMSVSAGVLAGLPSVDPAALSGAALHMLAVLLSMSGLWLHVRSVAARTGTADLRRLGGLVRSAPGLATGFFLLGLATVSFPGTATFLSEDLVVRGLLTRHPVAAAVLLVSTAVNGITLVRSFKRIFLGEGRGGRTTVVEDVLPRERFASLAILVALLVGGLAPIPLLLLREGMTDAVSPRSATASK